MDADDHDLASIAELIDGSFGDGPEGLPSPDERLSVGRRVVRRRRRLTAFAASGGLLLIVGTGVVLAGNGADRGAVGPSPFMGSSSPSPTTSNSPPPPDGELVREPRGARTAHRAAQQRVDDTFPVSFGTAGGLVVKDGWQITRRVDEPLGYRPPEASVAVAATNGEKTRWLLLVHEHAVDGKGHVLVGAYSDTGTGNDAGDGYSRFEDWLASLGVARSQPLVVVRSDDRVQPGPGVVLVDTAPLPAIDGYSSPGDRMVQVRREARTWFVVVRGHGMAAAVMPVDAAVLDAPTFHALVDHLRTQARSGEGLR
jgi:hypothetical protein